MHNIRQVNEAFAGIILKVRGKNKKESLTLNVLGLREGVWQMHMRKEKKEKVKKNKKRDEVNYEKRFHRGILRKLIVGFIIPVGLIMLLGTVSYRLALTTIVHNYKDSATETMSAIGKYFDLTMSTLSEKAKELGNNSQIVSYYTKDQAQGGDSNTLYREIKSDLMAIKTAVPSISAVHIIGEGTAARTKELSSEENSGQSKVGYQTFVTKHFSTDGELPADTYQTFIQSEEGQIWTSGKKEVWYGEHVYLDELLSKSSDSYAVSYVRKLSKGNGFFIIDLNMKTVQSVLEEMDLGEGSIVGLITPDGREITFNDADTRVVFNDMECFQRALEDREGSGYLETEWNDQTQLFVYSKIGTTGAMVCSMIPEQNITGQVQQIKQITIMTTIAAALLSLIIGLTLALGIGNRINTMVGMSESASAGNMTVVFRDKKKDELGRLACSLTHMVAQVRQLIGQVTEFGDRVHTIAVEVSDQAENILEGSKGIARAIDEIGQGNQSQAGDTQKCVTQMELLSSKIEDVTGYISDTMENTRETDKTVDKGMGIVEELRTKGKETTQITRQVMDGMEELSKQSRSIYEVVEFINEIADETNLLSLNASVEAARAGEAGRGFAVVADEVRKLADQSVEAVERIRRIIGGVQRQTEKATASASQAQKIVLAQESALESTIAVFREIQEKVNILTKSMKDITAETKVMEQSKTDTMIAVESISAISQQTAATTQEVNATVAMQTENINSMANKAKELEKDIQKLSEAIGYFQI